VGTVLFVCVENTFRSVLSEALFNAAAPPGWRAESAGVQAAAAINPVVPVLLAEIGIKLGRKTPRTATPDMVARASRVVTFGCLDRCPIGAKEKAEDWPIPGAMNSVDGPRISRLDLLPRRCPRSPREERLKHPSPVRGVCALSS